MSEPMDVLDKMVLGEATDEMLDDAHNEDKTTKVEESVALKTEDIFDEVANEANHLITDTTAANEQVELDENKNSKIRSEAKVTPKKRGADASNEETPTKKKRTPAKPKPAKNTENGTKEEVKPVVTKKKATPAKAKRTVAAAAEGDEAAKPDDVTVEPMTPKKKPAPAKSKNVTPKAATETTEATAGDEAESTTPKAKTSPSKAKTSEDGTPRKRSAPNSAIAPSRGIPTSWEEAGPADRMMVKMKEDGSDWNAIREAWKNVTGQETAPSTLPNRYNRIKVNMMHLQPGEDAILLTAMDEIERKYQNEKWALCATEMEAKGADKYPTAFIQKKFKELVAKGIENGNSAVAADDEDENEDETVADE